eukprot:2756522-Rhodomonas_salina.1
MPPVSPTRGVSARVRNMSRIRQAEAPRGSLSVIRHARGDTAGAALTRFAPAARSSRTSWASPSRARTKSGVEPSASAPSTSCWIMPRSIAISDASCFSACCRFSSASRAFRSTSLNERLAM